MWSLRAMNSDKLIYWIKHVENTFVKTSLISPQSVWVYFLFPFEANYNILN